RVGHSAGVSRTVGGPVVRELAARQGPPCGRDRGVVVDECIRGAMQCHHHAPRGEPVGEGGQLGLRQIVGVLVGGVDQHHVVGGKTVCVQPAVGRCLPIVYRHALGGEVGGDGIAEC